MAIKQSPGTKAKETQELIQMSQMTEMYRQQFELSHIESNRMLRGLDKPPREIEYQELETDRQRGQPADLGGVYLT